MHKTKRPYQLPEPLTCDLGEVADGVSVELAEDVYKRQIPYRRRHKSRQNPM